MTQTNFTTRLSLFGLGHIASVATASMVATGCGSHSITTVGQEAAVQEAYIITSEGRCASQSAAHRESSITQATQLTFTRPVIAKVAQRYGGWIPDDAPEAPFPPLEVRLRVRWASRAVAAGGGAGSDSGAKGAGALQGREEIIKVNLPGHMAKSTHTISSPNEDLVQVEVEPADEQVTVTLDEQYCEEELSDSTGGYHEVPTGRPQDETVGATTALTFEILEQTCLEAQRLHIRFGHFWKDTESNPAYEAFIDGNRLFKAILSAPEVLLIGPPGTEDRRLHPVMHQSPAQPATTLLVIPYMAVTSENGEREYVRTSADEFLGSMELSAFAHCQETWVQHDRPELRVPSIEEYGQQTFIIEPELNLAAGLGPCCDALTNRHRSLPENYCSEEVATACEGMQLTPDPRLADGDPANRPSEVPQIFSAELRQCRSEGRGAPPRPSADQRQIIDGLLNTCVPYWQATRPERKGKP